MYLNTKFLRAFLVAWCANQIVVGQDYTCTTAGRFPYQDAACRGYYLCVGSGVSGNGTLSFIRSNYTCPSTMLFNPMSQTCIASNTNAFNCNVFNNLCANAPLLPLLPIQANPFDTTTCRTYVQCMGIFPKYPTIVTCPGGLVFNNMVTPPQCTFLASCAPN